MSDPQVKKALKDLGMPLKPSATKSSLMIADKIRKASNQAAKDEARKQFGSRFEEKGTVWEGGIIPLMVALLPAAKEKPMIEAVSLGFSLAICDSDANVALATAANCEKPLVELCKDKSLLVQAHAAAAIQHVCRLGTAESRVKVLNADGLKHLTTMMSAADSDDAIAKQGINKAIPYKVGMRQEEAVSAICAIACETKARQTADKIGTLKQLIKLSAEENVTNRTKEETAGALWEILKEPSNRSLHCEAGGVQPLTGILRAESLEAQTRAAGALRETSREIALREQVVACNAVPALLALCGEGKGSRAHYEAAGVLMELSNEECCKRELVQHGATQILTSLLRTDAKELTVLENSLAALGFMCAHAQQNQICQIVELSETGYVPLQDAVCACSSMPEFVKLCEREEESLQIQALAAIASATVQHEANGKEAAKALAPKAAVNLLFSTGSEIVQANALKALIAMSMAFPYNGKEAVRLGLTGQLLILKKNSPSQIVRVLSTQLLKEVGVIPSVDHTGSGLLCQSLKLATPVHEQVKVEVQSVSSRIKQLRQCRQYLREKVVHSSHAASFLEIAIRDSGSYDPERGRPPFCGGCNGSVRLEPEVASIDDLGLSQAFGSIHEIKQQFPSISWADIIHMAAATAFEKIEGTWIPLVFGRKDAETTEEIPPEKLIPMFKGEVHEAEEAAAPAEDGEGGEEEAAEGEGEEGEAAKAKPPPAPKLQVQTRLDRMGFSPIEQVALIGMYASLQKNAEEGGGFTDWILKKAVESEVEDGSQGPPAEASAEAPNGAEGEGLEGEEVIEEGSAEQDLPGGWTAPGTWDSSLATLKSDALLPQVMSLLGDGKDDNFRFQAKCTLKKLLELGAVLEPAEGLII